MYVFYITPGIHKLFPSRGIELIQQMRNCRQNKKTPNFGRLLICYLKLVTHRIFLRNSLEQDLMVLYKRLIDLGMEYRDGEVILADLASAGEAPLKYSSIIDPMSAKTDFTLDGVNAMLASYDLGECLHFEPFTQGADQTNILLTTTKSNFVLRHYEKRSIDYAQFEIELLHFLADKSYPCAKPIANRENKYVAIYARKPFAIFEYLEGEHNTNPDNYLQVARVIGDLHKLTGNFKPKSSQDRPTYDISYCWNWAQLSAKKIESAILVKERLDWVRHELDQIDMPDTLPKGVCHGDTNPSNFLYQNSKLAAVLDFDQANYTWLLYDVANMIYWWTWPNNGELDIDSTQRLLTSYERSRPMTNREHEHIIDALKLVILIGMSWFLNEDEGYNNGKRKIEFLNSIDRRILQS